MTCAQSIILAIPYPTHNPPTPQTSTMASTPKFNAKSLHFERQEPAFLQKLRDQAAGRGDSDRHEVQQARPGKKPRLEMDDDDGPMIVYEDEAGASGGNVGREEYEMLMKGKGEGVGKGDEGEAEGQGEGAGAGKGGEEVENASGGGEEREREKQKVAEVGVMKKRKAVKVVVGQGEEPETGTKPSAGVGRTAESAKPQVKPKAKASKKTVKLSFDEPDS
jgi:hypothetical protein